MSYRKDQLDNVKGDRTYKPLIKIMRTDGGTNWLSISEYELQRIREVLLANDGEIIKGEYNAKP